LIKQACFIHTKNMLRQARTFIDIIFSHPGNLLAASRHGSWGTTIDTLQKNAIYSTAHSKVCYWGVVQPHEKINGCRLHSNS
jgi:hypothetical protein